MLSRSFKYHRPRALLCCDGRCPNCLVEVDGIPNVRACTAPLREGQRVRSQNAWPSLAFDVLAITDRLDRLLPIGFYYKTFYRPRRLWPLYEKVLRRVAGLGRVDITARPDLAPRTRHLHCDVAVVGGGPAGCIAALEAAAAGARVVLVDDQPALGGHLRSRSLPVHGDARIEGLSGTRAAQRLGELIAEQPGIETLIAATVFGIYEGTLLGVNQGQTVARIRAKRIVIATGAHERPALFDGNDRPGIMLGTAVLRLARLHGVRSGHQVVAIVDDGYGWSIVAELVAARVALTAVIDIGSGLPTPELPPGIEVIRGAAILEGTGSRRVTGLRIRVGAAERLVPCDAVAVSLRPEPATGLIAQDGGERRYDDRIGEFVAARLSDAVSVAGDVEGIHDDAHTMASGALAGLEAAVAIGLGTQDAIAAARTHRAACRASALARHGRPVALDAPGGRKQFVCLCEDVTVKEIAQGIEEGFEDLETLKRYSTLTMGPCQGKMCQGLATRLRATLTGETLAAAKLTTARPPFQPVSLAALAGPHLEPVRRTAMHGRHAALTDRWIDMGDWKRPHIYTSVEEECRAVRERVAIIDVSTLGKLEVAGADAGSFLDWLHPNRFSDLKIGRVRYRAMCDDAGIVLDDGTVARLGDTRFFLSTTTGTIDAMEQWLTWWLAGTDRDARVTNVTAQYAAVNLAGPRSREVLERLTETDVSKAALPYLAATEAPVAGVPAIILRIGFVGELSYEIHVPSDFGGYLWDQLTAAGADLGITPFGVEAQRVLRLEKQHAIVGQDTDGLSNPVESGMSWLVKADKDDFVGREAIAAVTARGPQQMLVGFELPERTVPEEGAAVIRDGRLVGRVTSSKWSPYLGKTIGMVSIPIEQAADGSEIEIRLPVGTVRARVATKPFYDPAGLRLRM